MFNEILQKIVVETGGGIGAVLMGYHGIAVDQFISPEEEVYVQMVVVDSSNELND